MILSIMGEFFSNAQKQLENRHKFEHTIGWGLIITSTAFPSAIHGFNMVICL